MIRFLCKSCNVRDKSSSFDFGLKTAIESAPTCFESAIRLPFRNRCTDFIGIILELANNVTYIVVTFLMRYCCSYNAITLSSTYLN